MVKVPDFHQVGPSPNWDEHGEEIPRMARIGVA